MRRMLSIWLTFTATLLAGACGGSDNALAPQFQPEVVNSPNVAFSLQATGLQDITDVVQYSWSNSSGTAVIHPATSMTAGTITLNIRDATGTVLYDGTVPPTGDITPPAGAAGTWSIRLTLSSFTGTINFEVQMQ